MRPYYYRGAEAIVCKAMAPECTVPIRTGRRATIRLARNIPRAVAISKAGVEFTNGKRPGALGR